MKRASHVQSTIDTSTVNTEASYTDLGIPS